MKQVLTPEDMRSADRPVAPSQIDTRNHTRTPPHKGQWPGCRWAQPGSNVLFDIGSHEPLSKHLCTGSLCPAPPEQIEQAQEQSRGSPPSLAKKRSMPGDMAASCAATRPERMYMEPQACVK